MFIKRIEPAASGFDCYLNNAKVGTRASENDARTYLAELVYDCERGAPLPFEPELPRTPMCYGPQIDPCYAPRAPISTLADGSTVYGQFDTDDSHFCVCTDTASGWYISADADGTAGIWHSTYRIDIDGMTRDQLASLKALVNSEAIEHLLACGAAWEGQGSMPAPQAPTPLVQVSRYTCPDTGTATSTIYTLGAAELDLSDDDVPPVVWLNAPDGRTECSAHDIAPHFWDALPDAVALLNSSEVTQALNAPRTPRRTARRKRAS